MTKTGIYLHEEPKSLVAIYCTYRYVQYIYKKYIMCCCVYSALFSYVFICLNVFVFRGAVGGNITGKRVQRLSQPVGREHLNTNVYDIFTIQFTFQQILSNLFIDK